jgi:hypothetical protein
MLLLINCDTLVRRPWVDLAMFIKHRFVISPEFVPKIDFVLHTPYSLHRGPLHDLPDYRGGLGPRCISHFGILGPLLTPAFTTNFRI